MDKRVRDKTKKSSTRHRRDVVNRDGAAQHYAAVREEGAGGTLATAEAAEGAEGHEMCV